MKRTPTHKIKECYQEEISEIVPTAKTEKKMATIMTFPSPSCFYSHISAHLEHDFNSSVSVPQAKHSLHTALCIYFLLNLFNRLSQGCVDLSQEW